MNQHADLTSQLLVQTAAVSHKWGGGRRGGAVHNVQLYTNLTYLTCHGVAVAQPQHFPYQSRCRQDIHPHLLAVFPYVVKSPFPPTTPTPLSMYHGIKCDLYTNNCTQRSSK